MNSSLLLLTFATCSISIYFITCRILMIKVPVIVEVFICLPLRVLVWNVEPLLQAPRYEIRAVVAYLY